MKHVWSFFTKHMHKHTADQNNIRHLGASVEEIQPYIFRYLHDFTIIFRSADKTHSSSPPLPARHAQTLTWTLSPHLYLHATMHLLYNYKQSVPFIHSIKLPWYYSFWIFKNTYQHGRIPSPYTAKIRPALATAYPRTYAEISGDKGSFQMPNLKGVT